MTTFERTLDYGIVGAILTHPSVARPALLPDKVDASDLHIADIPGRSAYLVRCADGMLAGAWIIDAFPGGWAEVHIAMLPAAWGSNDDMAGAFRVWLRHNAPVHTLLAKVPSYNAAGNHFALRVGMTRLGSIPGPVKDGDRRQYVVYGIVL